MFTVANGFFSKFSSGLHYLLVQTNAELGQVVGEMLISSRNARHVHASSRSVFSVIPWAVTVDMVGEHLLSELERRVFGADIGQ